MIKPLNVSVRTGGGGGLFHDSRGDIITLSKYTIEINKKVNELVDEANKLSVENKKLKDEIRDMKRQL